MPPPPPPAPPTTTPNRPTWDPPPPPTDPPDPPPSPLPGPPLPSPPPPPPPVEVGRRPLGGGGGVASKSEGMAPPVTPVDPPLAPTVRGLRCPPAAQSDHWYECVGVSLGDFEAWKPQKVGGCGWNRCPRNLVLSHVAQDTAQMDTNNAQLGDFGPFLGRFSDISWS